MKVGRKSDVDVGRVAAGPGDGSGRFGEHSGQSGACPARSESASKTAKQRLHETWDMARKAYHLAAGWKAAQMILRLQFAR